MFLFFLLYHIFSDLLSPQKTPLIEEYAVAAQRWGLNAIDLSEIARYSVVQSGYTHKQKQQWIGEQYYLGHNELYACFTLYLSLASGSLILFVLFLFFSHTQGKNQHPRFTLVVSHTYTQRRDETSLRMCERKG